MSAIVQSRPRLLDPSTQEILDRDGFIVIDCLDAADIGKLRRYFDETPSDVHRYHYGATIISDDFAYRAAVDRLVRATFEPHLQRLFTDYRACLGSFIHKLPNTPASKIVMHQDPCFVDEAESESIGIWCPLVDTTEENGCICAIPGSHRWNRAPRGVAETLPYPELEPLLRARYLRHLPMRAGQAFLFYQRIFHASPPNLGGQLRVVAGNLLLSASTPLRFYERFDGGFNVYEVDDAFYTRHKLGAKPDGRFLEFIPYRFDALTADALR